MKPENPLFKNITFLGGISKTTAIARLSCLCQTTPWETLLYTKDHDHVLSARMLHTYTKFTWFEERDQLSAAYLIIACHTLIKQISQQKHDIRSKMRNSRLKGSLHLPFPP